MLEAAVTRWGPSVALRRRRQPMQWAVLTWTEMGRQVRSLAGGLLQAGVQPGDRVGLLSRTRLEWTLIDYAILSIGAVTVPLYHSSTPNQAALVLRDSGATMLVVEDRAELERIEAKLEGLPDLRTVVVIEVMDLRGHANTQLLESLIRDGRRLSREDPERLEAIRGTVGPDDLATIVYTSGTTGVAKGVRLTHRNLMAAAHSLDGVVDVGPEDTAILFLPLSHIYARLAQLAALVRGYCLAFARRADLLEDVLREVRPTFFFAVPRIYERVYQGVVTRYRELPPLLQAAFRRGMAASRAAQARQEQATGRTPFGLRIADRVRGKVADRTIFEPVREALGGRVRFCISGGAPLNSDIARFFRLAGIEILEGYGLSETGAAATINPLRDNRIGTVGRPLPGVRVRIGPDGEVMIHGDVVFEGYHRRPEDTEMVLSEDGWLHTGDLGRLDAAGYLVISDRKKDIVITSGAKNVAPQQIESTLRTSTYISDAMVFGDRRPYLVALLALNRDEVEKFCRGLGLKTDDWSAVVRDPRVEQLVAGEVERLNARLARFEQVRRYRILPRPLSIEGGTLTPTFKVRRAEVGDRYKPLIEAMYAELPKA